MSHVHFCDVASALLILAAFKGSSRRLAVAGADPTTTISLRRLTR